MSRINDNSNIIANSPKQKNGNNSDSKQKFDVQTFNIEFERQKEVQKLLTAKNEEERIKALNQEEKITPILQRSVGEILIGIKDAWFDIIDDLIKLNITTETFVKNDRLFYIGLTIILYVLLDYIVKSLI